MVTEHYLNGTYYKYHQSEGNNNLLLLLPGQSISPRGFWEFKLPDGKTHVDYFMKAGIDVILFDPLGYGKSTIFKNYNRIDYANQITSVVNQMVKQYDKKAVFGFSTSTAPALIAGHNGYFNKIIVHSPIIRQHPDGKFLPGFKIDQQVLQTNFEYLVRERIEKVSDVLIPKSNKIDGWIERVKNVIGDNWRAPYQTLNDIHTYYCFYRKHDIPIKPITDVLSICGEYDNEVNLSKPAYDRFKEFFPHYKEVIIPNSTHFSMWENNSHLTREAMINFIKG
jgi:pimeloyl-ACP methyl ester carboxylesterase